MRELKKNDQLVTDNALKKVIGKIGNLVDWFEVAVISLSVFALAALLIANVIARNTVGSIYFTGELSGILVLVVTFIGVSYGVRKARHIRMGAFFDAMSPRLKKYMILVISIYGAGVMFIMAYLSFDYMMVARETQQITPALRIPYWITIIIMVLGFFSAGLQYVRTFIKNLVEEDVWLSPEQQSEYEAEG